MNTLALASLARSPRRKSAARPAAATRSFLGTTAGIGALFAMVAVAVTLRALATAQMYPAVGDALANLLPFLG